VPSKLSLFLVELKRRKVTRVAFTYLIVGVGVVEGADTIGSPLGLPTWVLPALSLLVVVGFPIALVLAWALEVTPQGIQRTSELSPDELDSRLEAVWSPGSWLLTGFGAVILLGVGYWAFFRGGEGSPPPEDRIAVLPFQNLTGDPELDELGVVAAHWMTDGLSRASGVPVIATSNVLQLLKVRGEGVTDQEVAASLGAGTVVSGVFTREGSELELRAQIVQLPGGEVLQSVQASGPADEPMAAVEALRQRVMGALALSSDRTFREAIHQIPSYEAYQAMARGVEEFLRWNMAEALPHFLRAYQLDTTFFAPLVFAAATAGNQGDLARVDSVLRIAGTRLDGATPPEMLQFEWLSADLAGDWERKLEAIRSLSRENPSFYAFDRGNTALDAGRPEEALRAMEGGDPDHPYWGRFPHVWRNLSIADQKTGRYREALEAARTGEERFPEDLILRGLEIRALIALGRMDEVGALLDEVGGMEPDTYTTPGAVLRDVTANLARRGHAEESVALAERALDWYRARDPDGYRLSRAQALLLADRPEEALALPEPLAEENPDSLSVRGYLGMALARTGDSAGAEAELRWLEGVERPYLRGQDTYWRTVILAHLGRKDEAIRLLRRAFQEGVSHRGLSDDSNLRPLWGSEAFEAFAAPRD
jgi:TolB-like protein/tetratricopeptide (TPR) repeat protein